MWFLILSLFLSAESAMLNWSDKDGVFTTAFDKAAWDYRDSDTSLQLSSSKYPGLTITLEVREMADETGSLWDLTRETLTRKGTRQSAAIINDLVFDDVEMRKRNASDGYYCDGVFGPDTTPISVQVMTIYRGGRVLVVEAVWPGTDKQQSYTWRKCRDEMFSVWDSIRAVMKP